VRIVPGATAENRGGNSKAADVKPAQPALPVVWIPKDRQHDQTSTFTEAVVRRAIAAARKEGLPIAATTVAPDGTVTIHHQGVAQPAEPEQDDKDNWANA
jgi:hypothetical protein